MESTKVKIVPYIEVDGIRTFTDSFIEDLYIRTINENLGYIFCEGDIDSSQTFLRLMKSGYNQLYVIFYDNDLAGYIWLNMFESKTARAHFCYFRKFWGKPATEIGKTFLSMCTKFLSVLQGLVPVSNKLAIRYCERLGMKRVGIIPRVIWNDINKKCEDGVLFYYLGEEKNEDI